MNAPALTITAVYSCYNNVSEESSSRDRIPLLSLNELCEKSRVTITLGNFVTKP